MWIPENHRKPTSSGSKSSWIHFWISLRGGAAGTTVAEAIGGRDLSEAQGIFRVTRGKPTLFAAWKITIFHPLFRLGTTGPFSAAFCLPGRVLM